MKKLLAITLCTLQLSSFAKELVICNSNTQTEQFFDKKNKSNKKGTWSDGIGSLALAIGIALTIRWGLIEAYVIPSGSMLPSLLIHDHIFVNKFVYGLRVPFTKKWMVRFKEPERGEVLVFKYPQDESTFFIKRIILSKK